MLNLLPSTASPAELSDPVAIAAIDPAMVLRLWSVIDVGARVRRAAAAEAVRSSQVSYLSGDAVA